MKMMRGYTLYTPATFTIPPFPIDQKTVKNILNVDMLTCTHLYTYIDGLLTYWFIYTSHRYVTNYRGKKFAEKLKVPAIQQYV